MTDFLKINRKGQILEIVLDRPKANALDAPSCWGRLADPCFELIPLKGIEKKVERNQTHEI